MHLFWECNGEALFTASLCQGEEMFDMVEHMHARRSFWRWSRLVFDVSLPRYHGQACLKKLYGTHAVVDRSLFNETVT